MPVNPAFEAFRDLLIQRIRDAQDPLELAGILSGAMCHLAQRSDPPAAIAEQFIEHLREAVPAVRPQ